MSWPASPNAIRHVCIKLFGRGPSGGSRRRLWQDRAELEFELEDERESRE